MFVSLALPFNITSSQSNVMLGKCIFYQMIKIVYPGHEIMML